MIRSTAPTIWDRSREDLVETLHDQVRRSTAAGARLLTGGERLQRKGFYYEPTVLSDVKPGMAAFDEETFGPVAAVTRVAMQKRPSSWRIELPLAWPRAFGPAIRRAERHWRPRFKPARSLSMRFPSPTRAAVRGHQAFRLRP